VARVDATIKWDGIRHWLEISRARFEDRSTSLSTSEFALACDNIMAFVNVDCSLLLEYTRGSPQKPPESVSTGTEI